MPTDDELNILGELGEQELAEASSQDVPALSVARVRRFFDGFLRLRDDVKDRLSPLATSTALSLTALRTRVTTLETEVGPAAGSRLDALEASDATATSRLDDLERRATALENTDVGVAARLDADEQELADHEARISALEQPPTV